MAQEWTVWREDDNGNSFAVDTFATELEAEAKLRELEGGSYQHRQTYWIARPSPLVGPSEQRTSADAPADGGTGRRTTNRGS